MTTDPEESDGMPLDGDPDLTAAERKALREMLAEQQRAKWAWKKLRLWLPIVGSAVYGLVHALEWAQKHYKP